MTRRGLVRGGSWNFILNVARSPYYCRTPVHYHDADIGFRVVLRTGVAAVRGGTWLHYRGTCRSYIPRLRAPDLRSAQVGFRVRLSEEET